MLGVAGIDPLGAILVASAIAAGVTRGKIILFTCCVFIFTILIGVFFSYIGTNFVATATSMVPDSNSTFWVYVNVLIMAIICLWLYRKTKAKTVEKPRKKLTGSMFAIAIVGIAFGAGAVFDPTFLAVISLAGQNGSILTIISMHTIWILISQIMLFSLLIAYLTGKHELVLSKSKAIWIKHKQLLNSFVTGAAILSIVILAIDILAFLVWGDYILL